MLNAANEVAVAAFLDGAIRFPDIAGVVEQALDRVARRAGRRRWSRCSTPTARAREAAGDLLVAAA